MSRAPLALEVGPAFVAGQIECDDERLVFATSASPAIQVIAAPPGLGTRRALGRLPGYSLPAGTIVGDRPRKRVFVAGDAGIWEFPLEGGAPSLACGLPDLPAASRSEIQRAYGANSHNANWVPHKDGRPSYRWVLDLDQTANRLVSLCGQEGALDHLVEVELESRRILSQVPMPGFCAGIEIDVKRRRLVLPALQYGPELLDFAGRQLAHWDDGQEHFSGRFWEAAFRPADGAVVLAEHEGGLWLWDWEHDHHTQLADDAAAPLWLPNGAVLFMRSSAELWMVKEGSPPMLIVRAIGNEGGTEFERKRSWVLGPSLSTDGRFVLAQLTAILKTKTAEVPVHDAVVLDLLTRRVQQVPGLYEQSIAWF